MARAYLAGHYTLKEVGKYFGVSYATVSRSVKKTGVWFVRLDPDEYFIQTKVATIRAESLDNNFGGIK